MDCEETYKIQTTAPGQILHAGDNSHWSPLIWCSFTSLCFPRHRHFEKSRLVLCKMGLSVFLMLIVIKSYSQHTKEMRLCPRETALWKIRILSNTLLLEFKLQNDESHRINLRASPQESKSCLTCSADCTSSVERQSPGSRDVTPPTLFSPYPPSR